MSTTYPNLNNEPELLKIKTRDDEINNLKYQTERHDHENLLKSLKIDNDLLAEYGFLKDGINRLNKEFKNILMEQNAKYLDYIKNQEEAVVERFFDK